MKKKSIPFLLKLQWVYWGLIAIPAVIFFNVRWLTFVVLVCLYANYVVCSAGDCR